MSDTEPPASGMTLLEASAAALASCSVPSCTVVEPVSVLAAFTTSVPAPVFVSGAVPEKRA